MSKKSATTHVWQIILIGAFTLGGAAGFAQTAPSADAAAPADQSAPAEGKPYAAVVSYLDSATKDARLSRIMAQYGDKKNNDGNKAFTDSSQDAFKTAYQAARDQPDLAAAVKSVRAAQIAVWTNYSREASANLNKAIADANVELELVQ